MAPIPMGGAPKSVGVVIPHFRAPAALQLTCEQLARQRGVRTEIYVRDNSEDNILFTRAINEGLRRFCFDPQFDFVLVLNQDARLHEECLQQLLLAMQAHPGCGISGAVALSRDKSVNWAGSGAAFPWGQHQGANLTRLPRQPFETYWVNGACMLLRTAMVREIGLLDENMLFICSDADYSFTARARGWTCMVVPSAFVEHEPSGSASTGNPWLNRIKLQDQLYFTRKWVNGDLYRSLALEGSQLTPELVEQTLRAVQTRLAAGD